MATIDKMRILEIVQSLHNGGRTTRFTNTVEALRAKGCYVLPLSLAHPSHWVDIDGLEVKERIEGFDWRLIIAIRRLIKSKRINIVHAHCELTQLYSGLACIGLKTAVVGTFHRSDLQRYKPSLLHRMIKQLLQRFVVVSKDRLTLLTDNLNYPQARCQVIHGGTPIAKKPEAAEVISARKSCQINEEQLALLSVGHLGKIKGHQDTLTALASCVEQFPNLHLYIAGDGKPDEKMQLETQVASLKLEDHVTFLGQINNVPLWLTACDIVIQPSIEEAFGIVFIEAGALAKPVIATNVGGIKEIILNDKTGLLVPPSAPKALSQALKQLLISPSQRMQMGDLAYNRINKHFSLDCMAEKYITAFKQTMR